MVLSASAAQLSLSMAWHAKDLQGEAWHGLKTLLKTGKDTLQRYRSDGAMNKTGYVFVLRSG